MADKDIRKLRRQDLLELLVLQSEEILRKENDIAEKNSSIEELRAMSERLKQKLNEKDEEIELLKTRLDQKDEKILLLRAQNSSDTAADITAPDDFSFIMQKVVSAVKDALKRERQEHDSSEKADDEHE